jgi:hypothetical protein
MIHCSARQVTHILFIVKSNSIENCSMIHFNISEVGDHLLQSTYG